MTERGSAGFSECQLLAAWCCEVLSPPVTPTGTFKDTTITTRVHERLLSKFTPNALRLVPKLGWSWNLDQSELRPKKATTWLKRRLLSTRPRRAQDEEKDMHSDRGKGNHKPNHKPVVSFGQTKLTDFARDNDWENLTKANMEAIVCASKCESFSACENSCIENAVTPF